MNTLRAGELTPLAMDMARQMTEASYRCFHENLEAVDARLAWRYRVPQGWFWGARYRAPKILTATGFYNLTLGYGHIFGPHRLPPAAARFAEAVDRARDSVEG